MNMMTISKDVQHMRIVTFWPMWGHEVSGHFLLDVQNALLVWLLDASQTQEAREVEMLMW